MTTSVPKHLDPPLVIDVDGERWHLPKLTDDDFADWSEECRMEARDAALKDEPPARRYAIASSFVGAGPGVLYLQELSLTPAGTRRTLRLSLAKMYLGAGELADHPKPDRDKAFAWAREQLAAGRLGERNRKMFLAGRLSGALVEGCDFEGEGAEGEHGPDPSKTRSSGPSPAPATIGPSTAPGCSPPTPPSASEA